MVCFGLRNQQQPNIWWILRGSKARLVSDGESVSRVQSYGMLYRCILAMSDGETESTLVGAVEGVVL